MKSSKKIIAIAAVAAVAFASQSFAQTILASDNFDRADGSLTGTVPTPGPGGAWTQHSGTEFGMQITSGAAVVDQGTGSEDTHAMFTAQSAGVLEANFDISVSAAAPIAGGDYEYFAHFMSDGSFNYRSRLYIAAPNSTGDYALGLSTSSGGLELTFPTDFSFDTTVNVTLAFDFSSGLSSLTVGATTIDRVVVRGFFI